MSPLDNIINVIDKSKSNLEDEVDYMKEMLLHVCHDLENCLGAVSTFELPCYLEEFWENNKDAYYEQQFLYQKKEKYAKMKKELEELEKEINLCEKR